MKKKFIKIICFFIPFKRVRRDFRNYLYKITPIINLRYIFLLKKIKKIVKNNNKIKVLFLVSENQKWSSDSLYNSFDKDPLFEPTIGIAVRSDYHFKSYDFKNNCKFFDKYRKVYLFEDKNNEFKNINDFNPNIVFYQQPWNLNKNFNIDKVSNFALTCYIPYGFMIAKFQDYQFNQEFHHACWKIFCETPFHKELFKKYSNVNQNNIIATGYPKMDVYLDKSEVDGDKIWKISKKENPNIKRIIWAPHWSFDSNDKYNILNFGTFDKNYKIIMDYIEDNQEKVEVCFKPHPSLYNSIISSSFMTEQELKAFFKKIEDLPNMFIYDYGNYFDLFKTSDTILLDSISFLAEYLPTEKPILFLNNNDKSGFNEFGEKLLDTFYVISDFKNLDKYIEDIIIKGNDPLKEKRINAVKNTLFIPENGSAEFIKNYLKDIFLNGR